MATTVTTAISAVPVTLQRPVAADLDKVIASPGLPRATRAVSKEKPQGSTASPDNATVLQQHVMFWDRDGDGIIYPLDTFLGFRRLGFNLIISTLAVPAMHFMGLWTWPTWLTFPDPRFPIHISRIHRTKHGSDTEVYDTEGRFVPQKFEDIFTKYDRGNKGGLDLSDMVHMVASHRNIWDPFGWIGNFGEWFALWLLCRDERGVVSKEKIRAQYDGTLWELVAAEVSAKKAT